MTRNPIVSKRQILLRASKRSKYVCLDVLTFTPSKNPCFATAAKHYLWTASLDEQRSCDISVEHEPEDSAFGESLVEDLQQHAVVGCEVSESMDVELSWRMNMVVSASYQPNPILARPLKRVIAEVRFICK